MNIIQMRREERSRKISELIGTLKKARSEYVDIDEKQLVLQASARWGMSLRVVQEYLKIAKLSLNNEKT